MRLPSDYLTSHFKTWVSEIAGETEVCDFEVAVGGDEEVVGFEILECGVWSEWGVSVFG